MAEPKRYWLLKTEPDVFSIHDLAKAAKKTTHWDGVRNYQARNLMRDEMHVGDGVLVYHSGIKPPAVAGTATIARAAYPDKSAQDSQDPHFDPNSKPDNPVWVAVDVKLDEIFPQSISLDVLRQQKTLAGMELLRRGSRLSVQRVSADQFAAILKLTHAVTESPSSKPTVKTKSSVSTKPTAKPKAATPKASVARSPGKKRG